MADVVSLSAYRDMPRRVVRNIDLTTVPGMDQSLLESLNSRERESLAKIVRITVDVLVEIRQQRNKC